MSGFPILEDPQHAFPDEQTPAGADAHLRSTQAVKGYCLHASDGTVGHVCDFMMDLRSWVIAHLVIKTGHRFSGREVNLPTRQVTRISYEESAVFVNLTKAAVEQSPAPHQVPAGKAA